MYLFVYRFTFVCGFLRLPCRGSIHKSVCFFQHRPICSQSDVALIQSKFPSVCIVNQLYSSFVLCTFVNLCVCICESLCVHLQLLRLYLLDLLYFTVLYFQINIQYILTLYYVHKSMIFFWFLFQVVSYKTSHALGRDSQRAAEGTLAYVSERGGELYIRTGGGWRKIQVCVCVCVRVTCVDVWHGWEEVAGTLGSRREIVGFLTVTVFFQLGELIQSRSSSSLSSHTLSRPGDLSRAQRSQSHSRVHTHTHTHIHIHLYI